MVDNAAKIIIEAIERLLNKERLHIEIENNPNIIVRLCVSVGKSTQFYRLYVKSTC